MQVGLMQLRSLISKTLAKGDWKGERRIGVTIESHSAPTKGPIPHLRSRIVSEMYVLQPPLVQRADVTCQQSKMARFIFDQLTTERLPGGCMMDLPLFEEADNVTVF
jgi:hypothetical protein